jgi:hypothetical protein
MTERWVLSLATLAKGLLIGHADGQRQKDDLQECEPVPQAHAMRPGLAGAPAFTFAGESALAWRPKMLRLFQKWNRLRTR